MLYVWRWRTGYQYRNWNQRTVFEIRSWRFVLRSHLYPSEWYKDFFARSSEIEPCKCQFNRDGKKRKLKLKPRLNVYPGLTWQMKDSGFFNVFWCLARSTWNSCISTMVAGGYLVSGGCCGFILLFALERDVANYITLPFCQHPLSN